MSTAYDLDRYAEGLGNLSMDLQTKLAQIHDLNNKIQLLMKRSDQLIDEYLKGEFPSEAKKREKKSHIENLFAMAKNYSNEKIMLSNDTYNLVDKNINRLDMYLKRYKKEIKTRAQIIRNAPDHHSEERRLARDKKEAEERERQKAKKRKIEESENMQEKQAKHLKTNAKRGDEDNVRHASGIGGNGSPRTSKNHNKAIDTQLNNIHITDNQPKASGSSKHSNERKSESFKHTSSSEKKSTNSQELTSKKSNNVERKSSSSQDLSIKNFGQSGKVKSSSGQRKSTSGHETNERKATSNNTDNKHSNSSGTSRDKKSTEKTRDESRRSKSNSSVKSSNEPSLSSKSRSQKEAKDSEKRKPEEKSTCSDEELSKGAIKKRKVSAQSNEDDEFNIPPEPDEPIYCFCQKVSYGDMVACDDVDCTYAWFHFGCVGLTRNPPGTWYCKDCAKKKTHKITKNDR